jgi:hypothetical protein
VQEDAADQHLQLGFNIREALNNCKGCWLYAKYAKLNLG